jgi:flagellar basal body-associated protein FliL
MKRSHSHLIKAIALLLIAISSPVLSTEIYASSASTEEAPPKSKKSSSDIEVTLKLDLGTIQLMNLEPTQGRTAHMSFDMHLVFDPKTDPKTIKELKKWQHRLREQVIVAVRATEIYDFLDPELTRFRKQILYRINRMLKDPIVTDALFANFTFSSQ